MKKILVMLMLMYTFSSGEAQWSKTSFSEDKTSMGFCSPLSGEFWFAGGEGNTGTSKQVEIFNIHSSSWRMDQLSEPRSFSAGIGSWGTAVFAGGINLGNYITSARVDIYHPGINGQPSFWTIDSLSVPRFNISAEIVEQTIYFAGGVDLQLGVSYDVVDIYSLATATWDIDTLSSPRAAMSSTVGHNALGETIVMFAGGLDQLTKVVSDHVDIYNVAKREWSTAFLTQPRGLTAATTAGNKILIAGGMNGNNTPSDQVDIYNMDTDEWTTSSLSFPRAFLGNAATVCDSAYFAGGGRMDLNSGIWISSSNIVDIYDPKSGVWKVDHLSNDVVNHAVVSDGDHLLVAGGYSFQNGGGINDVDIYKCLITGIQKVRQSEKWISVFPNPANRTLYLTSTDEDPLVNISVSIFDMQGERLYNALLKTGETELQLNLPAGVYLLRLTGKDRTQTEIIIIQ